MLNMHLHRKSDSFVGFLRLSKNFHRATYTNKGSIPSWDSLVTDYLNVAANPHTDNDIDNRPLLNVPVCRVEGCRRLLDIEKVVCLKRRDWEQRFVEPKTRGEHLRAIAFTGSVSAAQRPPALKKRKLISDSTALQDMLGG